MGLTMFGLLLIGLGWFVQLITMEKKNPKINMWFLVSYIVGAFLLIFDSISTNAFMSALLNAVTVFAATGVLLKSNK